MAERSDGSLERFRAYLRLLATIHLDPRLAGKFDPSDVVQETMVQAIQAREQFRGEVDGQMAAWLRRILARNLAQAVRAFGRDKRDVRREQSLEAGLAESSSQLEAWLAAEESSPSEKAEQNEETLRLAQAIEQLPQAQREALTLQHWHGFSLAEIGERLERSPEAVAGLLKRGLKQLRLLMHEGES